MKKNDEKQTVTMTMENFFLRKIERFRQEQMRRSGHISRSGAIRILVNLGLEFLEAKGSEKPQLGGRF